MALTHEEAAMQFCMINPDMHCKGKDCMSWMCQPGDNEHGHCVHYLEKQSTMEANYCMMHSERRVLQ